MDGIKFETALDPEMHIETYDGDSEFPMMQNAFEEDPIQTPQGKPMPSREEIQAMIQQLEESRDYACETCGKTFKYAHHVQQHQIVHNKSSKRYKCDYCPKSFSRSYVLNRHMQSHKNVMPAEKSFQCGFCEALFPSQDLVQLHMITHQLIPDFQCNFCLRIFAGEELLNQHLLGEHQNEFAIAMQGGAIPSVEAMSTVGGEMTTEGGEVSTEKNEIVAEKGENSEGGQEENNDKDNDPEVDGEQEKTTEQEVENFIETEQPEEDESISDEMLNAQDENDENDFYEEPPPHLLEPLTEMCEMSNDGDMMLNTLIKPVCNIKEELMETGAVDYEIYDATTFLPFQLKADEQGEDYYASGSSQDFVPMTQIPEPLINGKTKEEIQEMIRQLEEARDYVCQTCGKAFKYAHHLQQHQSVHIAKNVNMPDVKLFFKQENGEPFLNGQTKEEIQAMIQQLEDSRDYACDTCGKTFKYAHHLQQHQVVHTGSKIYQCDYCPKSYSRSYVLNRHVLSHSVETPFKCDACDAAFNTPQYLKDHIKTYHPSMRTHNCSICNKSFDHAHTLTRHMTSHLNVKQFQCNVCDSTFAHANYLKVHMAKHSDVRPYICEICNKDFSRPDSLRRHRKSHSDVADYTCPTCDKKFKFLDYLKKHMLTHVEEKLFECDVCEKKFTRPDVLNRHRKTHE